MEPWTSCDELRNQQVRCAYGTGLIKNEPDCPDVRPLTEALQLQNLDKKDAEKDVHTVWLDDVSIIVPEYPYPANIYHYGNVITLIAHIATHLSAFPSLPVTIRRVNIVFRGLRNGNIWQKELIDLMFRHRIQPAVGNISVHYLKERDAPQLLCTKQAILLGRRGHVNVWPFPNSTNIMIDGSSVPAEAVAFRKAAYKAFNIPGKLPGEGGLVQLPPLTIGYARRLGPDEIANEGHSVHAIGTKRRFSAEDEKWLVGMLKNESAAAKMKLKVIASSGMDSLKKQVNGVIDVGFVVGIHGANLVNSVFMRPFGAMLEVFPNNVSSTCYIAGSNSGLAYYRHEAIVAAGALESGCRPEEKRCMMLPRQRLVKLGTKKDRDMVKAAVRKGIRHLLRLHEQFPKGIPVEYRKATDTFNIAE